MATITYMEVKYNTMFISSYDKNCFAQQGAADKLLSFLDLIDKLWQPAQLF